MKLLLTMIKTITATLMLTAGLLGHEQSVKVEIGIAQQNREQVAQHVQKQLANHFVLYTKTLKYHWNVKGKHFNDLHKFFGKLYAKQHLNVDMLAERIRALGFDTKATLKEFIDTTTLQEQPNSTPDEQGMIKNLLNDYQTIIQQLRKDLEFAMQQGDHATNNFLTDLVQQHEKTSWMLRALLSK